jgi:dihydrodipicolinate synthase/N-acetylneuraminate lyase
MKLQGIFAALATPFDYKGEIYKAKVQHNVEKWNRVAIGGYAVATRVGEGNLLTFDERVELFRLVRESAAPDRVLLADVTKESVKESLMLAERAAELGYQGVLCTTLFVGDKSPLPVVTELPVMLDSAARLWTALKTGSPGAILGFASAAPYSCVAVWEAFRTREEEAGLDWQARIAHPSELVSDVAALKYAMDLNGYYGGPPRLPLPPATRQTKALLEDAFRYLKG